MCDGDVGVRLAHQGAPAEPRFLERRIGADAENLARRAGAAVVAGEDGGKAARRQFEDPRHFGDEDPLGLVQGAVCGGDHGQTLDDLLEDGVLARKQRPDALRPGVKADRGLPGQVEDACGVLFLATRDDEDSPERRDLGAQNGPVGLGEFGAERDDRNGEGDRCLGRCGWQRA